MKVDVISVYYKQAKYAPSFFWGIMRNRENVNRVIIVNDEPWETEDIRDVLAYAPGVEVKLLEHPHAGPGTHGVAHSFNQGMDASDAEYAFLTSFDQVFPEDMLDTICDDAAPQRLVMGKVHIIRRDSNLDHPTVLRRDGSETMIDSIRATGDIMPVWRNGHTLVHRPSHHAVGGFDERFVRWGYGLEDYDYAIRWMLQYGRESVVWGDSFSWHFGDEQPSRLNPKKQLNPEAVEYVNGLLRRLYDANHVSNGCFLQSAPLEVTPDYIRPRLP